MGHENAGVFPQGCFVHNIGQGLQAGRSGQGGSAGKARQVKRQQAKVLGEGRVLQRREHLPAVAEAGEEDQDGLGLLRSHVRFPSGSQSGGSTSRRSLSAKPAVVATLWARRYKPWPKTTSGLSEPIGRTRP